MTPHDNELRYWLALTFVKDVGPVTCKHLLARFHSARAIMEAPLSELTTVEGISTARAKKIHEFRRWDLVDREIEEACARSITLVSYFDDAYPESLKQLDDSPVVLYTKGMIERECLAFAIVGSRMMSDYGRRIAHHLSYGLASYGFAIVSGMARGIDTVAHRGALKAGGKSIAVLGCGLDTPYPPENKPLFEELSSSGCVLSEFPLGTPPNRENFPKRNRLISGLSLGVLIVEATNDSGSLITARCALEQGRDVFAVPGPLFSENSEGTNALIKQGAKLVQSVDDILEELSPAIKRKLGSLRTPALHTSEKALNIVLSDEEKALCALLQDTPKHVDVLSRALAFPPQKLSEILLTLELKGIISHTEGNMIRLEEEEHWRNH